MIKTGHLIKWCSIVPYWRENRKQRRTFSTNGRFEWISGRRKEQPREGDVMQTSGPITHGEVRSLQDDTGGALGLPDLTHMPPFLRHSHSVHYLPTGRTKTNASCCCRCCWSLLYNAIFRSRADSMRPRVILHVWLALYSAFFLISSEVVYLQRWHGWCHVKLLPSRRVLCTPYNHTPCHFMQSLSDAPPWSFCGR